MRSLKIFGILFIAIFLSGGVVIILGALLAAPLLRWAIHGVLYFPVSGSELWLLARCVLGITVCATLAVWLEGKWKGRW